ncbi:hypothetical protein TpMuguga_01g00150 [Theileria parva strain Muguga]|uniref:Uncharacterized protein n=1 Tax=Theileria parva TaxID=5875 RepID=Q4N9G4_THEPA|nr:uncharacterized protein TpMuguga_01g00150 [Theileria parva strain Muguga]EAN33394.1 hypothetical protein TpMuguga_01g00150 [Theileria parva strain Muguga]|eukprot:XP_765677.1 hypothetical protein [Theileria parva strain Muguga]
MSLTWSESDVNNLIKFAKQSFNNNDRANLEKCVRNGSCSEYSPHSDSLKLDKNQNNNFKRGEDDLVGQLLDDLWSSYGKISLFLEEVIESASATYRNIVNKGVKQGLSLPSDSDYNIAFLSWKNQLNKYLKRYVIQQLQSESIKMSRQGSLFSLKNEYNNFDGETISNLMFNSFTVVNNFTGQSSNGTFSELEFMEYNGLFKRVEKSTDLFYDNCFVLWLNSSQLDKTKHKNTKMVLEKLCEIPYELTNKCKILLQVISSVCVTYMEAGKSSIMPHVDGENNGVQFTCLYVPKSPPDSSIDITINQNTHTVNFQNDQLIILGKNVKYEIKKVKEKCFIFMAWLTGPD